MSHGAGTRSAGSGRRIARTAGWLLVVGAAFLPVLPNPPLSTGTYLQAVEPTRAVLARIEPSPRALVAEVHDSMGELVARVASPTARRHAVPIEGLRPGREYTFTMRDADGASLDSGRLRTAAVDDAQIVRFLVVGDSGKVPWWAWLQDTPALYLPARYEWLPDAGEVTAVGRAMAKWPVDLWFHVGDVIYPYGEHRHYAAGFFRPFGDLLRQAPCYAVIGNHDHDTNRARPFTQNFVVAPNSVSGDRRMFSFRDGPVRFIGIDLNRTFDASHPSYRFLEQELSHAAEPWVVVLSHPPVFSASRQTDRRDLIRHLAPLLRRYRVDLYLCGHDHNYQRFGKPGEPIYVVSGGGGKSLYELRHHTKLEAAYAGWQFVAVEVDGPVMRLQCVGLDGNPIDRLTIDKRMLDRSQVFGPTGNSARDQRVRALLDGDR